ncbi:MAG: LuxR C-terminal-related transcriptional regulator [Bacteroidales bacterium]|nr:LuxR C-terminal-related transcriptional regulator [Bacteroidales bacterium]
MTHRLKRKNRLISLLAFILCLPGFIPSSAQDKAYGIPQTEYFSRRAYNAANQNWCITQSNNDLLYFANNDGVLEFDGVGWKIYRDMGAYVIRSVKSVGDRIYAGTFGELGYFSYRNSRNLSYTSLANNELRSYADYWNIHSWNGKIIFHSEQALCIFEDDSLLKVLHSPSRFTGSFLVNGLMLVQDETTGLMEVRGENIYPVTGGDILKDKLVTSILPISENIIVIGTLTDGLYTWDMQSIRRWNVTASEVLKTANIYCATTYEKRYLVFGTIQSGVIITDRSGNIIYQVGKDKGSNNNTVLSLFVDKDGNVWGGLDNGIVRINLRSTITFLQGYYDLGTGYVINSNNEQWYFGTNQGLFTITNDDFSDPLKDRYDFVKMPGTDGQVWSLFKSGNTLLCGHNLGVLQIKGNEASLITPAKVNGAWTFREVPGKSDLLIAGTYSGLILLEKHGNDWAYKMTVEGFDESSRYIEWSRDGKLWISHGYKGIFCLQFNDDYSRVTRMETFPIEDYPEIGPAPVISIVDEELLVTSNNGIYRVNDSGKIEQYNRLDEYFSKDFPSRLMQDRFRNIWYFLNGGTGVLRFMEDETFKKIEYPLMQLENKLVPSFESVYVIDRNNVLFGVEDGFAHYSVREGMEFTKPFKVHIRSFKGSSDTTEYILCHDGGSVGSQQDIIPEYVFRDNQFDIQYAAPYFREGVVEYSTYLSNYDLEATAWNRNTGRQFAKLREGNYEFIVKARNSFGVQSEPLIFHFRVLPPWYRTLAAKISYVILILILILLIVYVFNRRIEINKQNEKIKQEETYRAREEKLKNEALETEKELIRMRNERLRSEMNFKEKELANSTMNILQKNESLMKIKSEMLKINSLHDKSEIKKQIKRLVTHIEKDIDSEDYWKVFEVHLEQVHEAFLKRLSEKHPDLSNREMKLCAYIRMGMSSKEIAALTNISFRAVENNRYRMRQKLSLPKGDNLSHYIASL